MKKQIVFLALLLYGCASQPVPTGNGWYQLDHTSNWGAGGSEAGVKAEAEQEAEEFCAKQGKKSEVGLSYARGGILGIQLAKASIQFRCVDGLKK